MSRETKLTKLSFGTDTKEGESISDKKARTFLITDEYTLAEAVNDIKESFPLLNNGDFEVIGEFKATGVVLTTTYNGFNNVVVAALPHPETRLKKISPNREVIFGGMPTNKNLEPVLEMPIGQEDAKKIAGQILKVLESVDDFAQFSQIFNGMGAIGSEPESWVINPNNGDLVAISGGELQKGLLEETLEPISDPKEFLIRRAKNILIKAENYPNFIIIDASVLPTSNPLKPEVNDGHDLGPYVLAIQRFLWENYFSFNTPEAVRIGNQIATSVGFSDIQSLHKALGHMAYWVMAASHASVGIHHLRTGGKALWVPAEWAIAVSDIFNSDLATVAEFLMFSTPVIYNQTPTIRINNKEFWPNDYRAILRYLMDTSNPGEFIKSPDVMYERIIYSIVSGLTHTMDRGSYLTTIDGRLIPIAHGRVRNRIATNEPRNLTGRVEFTGCGASPSVIDEVARNCFLQILMIGAMEAVANGKTPQEYFVKEFPHIASWKEQKDLAIKTSLFGFGYEKATNLIQEAIRFIDYISKKYSALGIQATIATTRIKNLLLPSANSLDGYLHNPQGSIAGVLKNELISGVEPLELIKRIHQYELELSRQLLGEEGPLYWLELP